MPIDDQQASAAAAQLLDAAETGGAVELFTARFDDFSVTDARAIARHTDMLRRSRGGTRVGYKLGWTSEAMRTALGIERPNWGTLWDSQVLGAVDEFGERFEIDMRVLRHAKVEPELVWRCPVEIVQATEPDEIEALGGTWALGLEVVHPRFASFNFDWLDNTADNSSAAALAIGRFGELDTGTVTDAVLTFTDGEYTAQGSGRAVMGSPFIALAWLTESLAAEGTGLASGDLVFTGGLTAPRDVEAGRTYELHAPWGSLVAVAGTDPASRVRANPG